MQISSRGMRRASLALALGVTGAAALAPAAFATTRVNFTNTPDGASVDVSDNVPAGSVSATLRRNGSPLASNTGFGGAWGNFVGIELPNKGTLSPGDDVQLIRDGAVVNTVTYDGKPTVNADACTGAKTITGTAAGTTSFFAVTAFTPGGGSGSSDNPATITRSGEGYTAKFGKPLAKGDKLYVSQAVDNGDLQVSALNIKDIGDCPAPAPAPVAKPAAVPAAPTATQILAGLQATLGEKAAQFAKLDIASVAKLSAVNVPFTFLVPGSVQLTWIVANTSASAAAKKTKKTKTLKLASGGAKRSTAGAAKVKLKLSKAGKKFLRHAKKVRVTFTAAFTPAGGGAVQRTQTKFTLKKHASKKAKKTKKH